MTETENLETIEFKFTREETYQLALKSVLRWVDRWYDNDFEEPVVIQAIEQVARTALN